MINNIRLKINVLEINYSETWVTTTRDMTRLEAAEMLFLRSSKGYTRLDKIRSEVIRKELEISGIQDVRPKHKQNWINHLERMDNTRLPKHALNYKARGRRDRGRPRKRWQCVDAGTGQRPNPWRKIMINYRKPDVIRHISRQCASNYKYSYSIYRENTASLH